MKKWLPELNEKNARAIKLFVGNKIDLRNDNLLLTAEKNAHIMKQTAEKILNEMGHKYIECSAMTQEGLKTAFDEAIRSFLKKKDVKVDLDKENCKCSLI